MKLTRRTCITLSLCATLVAALPYAVSAQDVVEQASPPPTIQLPFAGAMGPVVPVAPAPAEIVPAAGTASVEAPVGVDVPPAPEEVPAATPAIPPAAPGSIPAPPADAPVANAPAEQPDVAAQAPEAVAGDEEISEYISCPAVAGVAPPPLADMAALEKDAQAGSAPAAFDLANEFARLKKFPEAEKWYRFALYKGDGRSALGLYDLHTTGSIKLENPEKIKSYGLNLMQESAKKGSGGAAMNLAMLYLYGQGMAKDYNKAIEWLMIAEADKKPMASYELGLLYSNGLAMDTSPRRAFHYFEKAAAAGIAPATRQVAIAYHTGIGAEKNLDKAITCYTRAADQGDVLAMRDLGNIYKLERVRGGSSEAWYRKAADLGDADSQYMLGRYQEAAKQKHHMSRMIVEPEYVPKE